MGSGYFLGLLRFSSLVQSAVSVLVRRSHGVTTMPFNKDLAPVEKTFVDKIRESRMEAQSPRRLAGTGPEYQQERDRGLLKLRQMYGKAGMILFPASH